MQITLLRHGKPEFELAGSVRAKDLRGIAESYDMVGIIGSPPQEVIDVARNHNIIVCSDLPRALQSAKALGVANAHSVDAMFRETAIPHFSNGSVKLPIGVWVFVLRSLWLIGFSKNGESFTEAKQRARVAAQRLTQLAMEFENVLLVGHGFINYFIAKELISNNWSGPARPGSNYWGYGVYTSHAT